MNKGLKLKGLKLRKKNHPQIVVIPFMQFCNGKKFDDFSQNQNIMSPSVVTTVVNFCFGDMMTLKVRIKEGFGTKISDYESMSQIDSSNVKDFLKLVSFYQQYINCKDFSFKKLKLYFDEIVPEIRDMEQKEFIKWFNENFMQRKVILEYI